MTKSSFNLHRGAAGFTLIELLVVVGIISLLISILLPTLATMRRSAARTACAMQMRDLGNAFQMYINDAKGRIPGELNPLPLAPPTKPNLPTLFETFDRYLGKSRKSWVCPADRMIEADLSDPVLAGHERYADAYGVSYEYNFYMNVLSPGQPFVKILADAQTVFRITPTKFRVLNDLTHFHGPAGRYGNLNFLFADWHVGDLEGNTSGKLDNPSGKTS